MSDTRLGVHNDAHRRHKLIEQRLGVVRPERKICARSAAAASLVVLRQERVQRRRYVPRGKDWHRWPCRWPCPLLLLPAAVLLIMK